MENPEQHDPESPEVTNRRLSAVSARDTTPERKVRDLINELGYQYETHRQDLPGTPDIVLEEAKTVILVHGCFWHHHEGCPYAKMPKKNQDYWRKKFKRNKERDKENRRKLKEKEWNVLVIWECQTSNIEDITEIVTSNIKSNN